MRFHHSTRRRTTRFSQGPAGGAPGAGSFGACGRGPQASRWAQLSYCRMTNIHFQRRHQVEPPLAMQRHDAEAHDEPEQARPQQQRQSSMAAGGAGEWPAGERVASDNDASDGSRPVIAPARLSGAPSRREALELELERLNLVGPASGTAPAAAETKTPPTASAIRLIGEQLCAGAPDDAQSAPPSEPADQAPPPGERRRQQADNDNKHNNSDNDNGNGCGDAKLKHANERRTARHGPGSKLDIESARAKLIAQVEKHPFWSNKAAKRMRLLDVSERQIYIYELASFCERRDLEWRYEPFRGVLTRAGGGARAGASLPGAGSLFQQRARLTSAALARQRSLAADACQDERHSAAAAAAAAGLLGGPSRAALEFGSAELHSDALRAGTQQQQQTQQQQVAERRQQFTFASGLADECRRSLVGRNCASAASSPVHEGGVRRHLAAGTPTLSPQATCDDLVMLGAAASLPAERPLPSAQYVWSIEPAERARPSAFTPSVHTSELPQSSFVKRCHGCSGRGRLKCSSCYGVGYEVCVSCSGKGTVRNAGARCASAGAAPRSGSMSPLGGRSTPGQAGSRHASPWAEPGEAADSAQSAPSSSRRYDEPGGVTQSSGGAAGWQVDSCHFCHGAGQKRCWICAGRAYQTCTACAGTGQLRCYLSLNITWLNHCDECVLNNSDAIIPRERLKLCSGLVLLDKVASRLQPLETSLSLYAADLDGAASSQQQQQHHHHHQHHHRSHRSSGQPSTDGASSAVEQAAQQAAHESNPAGQPPQHHQCQQHRSTLSHAVKPSELNQLHSVSSKLLDKHRQAYMKQERMLKQRHTVTQIECFIVNWEWKRRRGHFVIYGDERKVYIAKYPFKSICGIT